ncbi:MAG: hypothetical protein JKX72_02130 [Robiginitomaculum sp.]|nr:hypothetical protein [Robiginitomaculum sp.]
MTKLTALLGAAIVTLTATPAFASNADVYVVTFRADDCQTCGALESQLKSAMSMVNSPSVEQVTIDTTNALQWEKSAHTAFDRNIVPQFNKWVGKTGFVAIVDAKTQTTIGCVSAKHDVYKMANFIKSAAGLPSDRQVSNRNGAFKCPTAQNVDTGE